MFNDQFINWILAEQKKEYQQVDFIRSFAYLLVKNGLDYTMY